MGQITQTTTQLQTILDDSDASNSGNTSISDASDTTATSLKKSGFYSLQASSSNAPSTDRAVVISAVRDTAATGEIRYGQVLITESNGLWWNSDDGGSLGTWYESVATTATQTLTNKTLTSPVLTTPQINDSAADHQYVFAVANLAADRTVTLPLLTGTDTFVFEAHTQTLTNKTLTSAVLNTGVSGTAVLDEDNMASNSATKLATQQSIKAYVDAQVDTVDTLAEILAIGNTTGGTDVSVTTTDKVQFRDSAIYLNSSVDGQLDIVADTEIQIAATTIDINGAINASGEIIAASLDISGNIDVDGVTNLDVVDIDGAVDMASTLAVAGVLTGASLDISGDIDVDGVTNLDVVDIDGAVDMASTLAVAGVLTGASLDISGDIDVDGTTNLDVVDIDGAVNMATTALVTGVLTTTATQVATGGITSGSSILSDTDSTDSLGSTAVRWLKGWFDTLTAGTLTIGSGSVTDSSGAISFGNENLTTTGIVTAAGTSVFTNLDISGNVDVDGTLNVDAIDIDGALQLDGALTVGVDDTGYDVKFFGATSGAYMLWDESADDLKLVGAAGFTVAGDIDVDGTANLDIVDIDGAVDFASTTAHAGNATFADNAKAILGAGPELEIYSNGTVGYIDTAQLIIANAGHSANIAKFIQAGAVELYHNNTKRIETTSSGLSVYGGAVFNEDSADADFRVESDGNANMLFVDGGNDSVGIGTASTATGVLTIPLAGVAVTGDTDGATIGAGGIVNLRNTNDGATNSTIMLLGTSSVTTTGQIASGIGFSRENSGNWGTQLRFYTHSTSTSDLDELKERFRIAADGSLSTPTLGTDNVRFGENAGNSIVSGGDRNVLVGKNAGTTLTGGDSNVAIGWEALQAEDDHANNVAVGASALATLNAGADGYNVAMGYNAGKFMTTGIRNSLVGGLAGDALTDADYNVAIGYLALSADTLGSRSVAIGTEALQSQNFTSATDAYNTAVGNNAGAALTTGISNTFIGALAGDTTDDGVENTAVGMSALKFNAGDNNTTVGHASLYVCTGDGNTAMGASAGSVVSGGGNNLLLGKDSGITGSPGGAITGGSNEIVLGDENISKCNVQVDWTIASDERDKTDFTALDLGLDFVNALAPVTYKWDKRSKYIDKTDVTTYDDDGNIDHEGWDITTDLNAITHDGTHKEDWLDVGFKAQDVETLEKAAGYKIADKTNLMTSLTDDGKQYGIQYSKFVPILVKAIQEQNALIEALTSRIETLEG